jgi:hypothetical protein
MSEDPDGMICGLCILCEFTVYTITELGIILKKYPRCKDSQIKSLEFDLTNFSDTRLPAFSSSPNSDKPYMKV